MLYYPSTTEKMRIGFANGSNYYFHGRLDEFMFYSGNLNAEEIADLYNLHSHLVNPPIPQFTFNRSEK